MKSMTKLHAVMEVFTAEHYKITANMISVFCFVAARSDKIIETRHMPEELGLPQTTINRLVRTMADRSYVREEGLKWLRVTTDPQDERQRIVELTTKGRVLAHRVREIMEDDQ